MWFVEIKENGIWTDTENGINTADLHISEYPGFISELWFNASDSLINFIKGKGGKPLKLKNLVLENEIPLKTIFYTIDSWCIKEGKIYALDPRKNVFFGSESIEEHEG